MTQREYYKVRDILTNIEKYCPEVELVNDDYENKGCFNVDDYYFEFTFDVKGRHFSGVEHDPYYRYEGYSVESVNVTSMTVNYEDFDDVYCLGESAPYIADVLEEMLSYENWS